MLTEVQRTTAGLLARGRSARSLAKQLSIGRDTIRAWQRNAEFIAEFERVTARLQNPHDPHGLLLDALQARKDDQIDWPSRLRAALALLELGEDSADDSAVVSGEW